MSFDSIKNAKEWWFLLFHWVSHTHTLILSFCLCVSSNVFGWFWSIETVGKREVERKSNRSRLMKGKHRWRNMEWTPNDSPNDIPLLLQIQHTKRHKCFPYFYEIHSPLFSSFLFLLFAFLSLPLTALIGRLTFLSSAFFPFFLNSLFQLET